MQVVFCQISHCRGCRRWTQSVAQNLIRALVPKKVMLDAMPGSLVSRLFLAPDDIFCFRVAVDLNLEFFMRKRIQLLDADNRHIFESYASGGTSTGRNIPCPQQAMMRRTFCGSSFSASGMTVWKLPLARSSRLDTDSLCRKQAFGAHDDKRLAKRANHLPPQHVEHLCGGGSARIPGYCIRRTAADSARGAPTSARVPGLRSHEAASSPARTSRPHFASPEAMNWSITTCAPLAKSPNCASQTTSSFGSAVA